MSKRQKQENRLFLIPAPTDYRWDDLIKVMQRNQFTEKCGSGSHYMFEHKTGFKFSMSKSHPSGILKQYQIRAAKEALKTIGVTGLEN